MVNVALWDAIERHLGGTPVETPASGRRHRNLTPFNAQRRSQKVAAIDAHCKRNPRDKQSETHAANMRARLLSSAGAL